MARWISKATRTKIYNRDNHQCLYCGKICQIGNTRLSENPGDIATLDHIVSQKELAAAATDDQDFSQKRRDPKNLVVACMSCNSSKQHTPIYVYCQQKQLNYAQVLNEISRRINIDL